MIDGLANAHDSNGDGQLYAWFLSDWHNDGWQSTCTIELDNDVVGKLKWTHS